VNGLVNATTVSLADYSNYGNSLTLVAATDSSAVDKLGNVNYFSGTSAANPNLAGIASLVWSVNPTLTAGQVRQILTETAMDLGIPGRDVTYGQGLVNADAAVRRAVAIGRNAPVANLHAGTSLLV
jgi:serine protease